MRSAGDSDPLIAGSGVPGGLLWGREAIKPFV